MKKEAFQEIAKHFADSIKVQLVFQEGATPTTNGSTITLPTEMSTEYIDETLGALLHETAHIRYTSFDYFRQLDEIKMLVGNALEDIRIDYKSLKTYPNSKCFYVSLINDALARCKDKIAAEEIPMKKLKSLILDAFGIDIQTVYGEDEKWEEIKECTDELRSTIFDVYDCAETKDLAPHIDKVLMKIFETDGKSQPQKGSGNPQNQPCNGGQGGEGANSEQSEDEDDQDDSDNEQDGDKENDSEQEDDQQDDSNIDDDGQQNNDVQDEKESKKQKAMKDYVNSVKDKAEMDEAVRQAQDNLSKASEEWSRLNRSQKTYNGKARRLSSKERYGGTLTADEKTKLERARTMTQQRSDEIQQVRQEYAHAAQELRNLNANGIAELNKKYAAALKELTSNGFGQADNCNLLGFNALDTEKLLDKNYVDIPYNPTLDELVKEVLILKQEEMEAEETGRLNSRYLHEIYTDVENLFQEKEEKKIKTRVSLVVDNSGSMGGVRIDYCVHAINLLAEAFKKAINQGAPGDMRIYGFGNDVGMVIDNVDNYKAMSGGQFESLCNSKGLGRGTNLAKAVNHVVNEVEGDPEYRNVIIIITDAEVDNDEISSMTNNICTSDARVMYISVCANFYSCPKAQEVFGDNNITNKESAGKILEQVMFQGLQMVN